MRHVRMLVLCLFAAFALSAVAVASASAAERPEYKACVKQVKNASKEYEGKYSGKYCRDSEAAVNVATEGKYEREAVNPESPEAKFVSKGGRRVEVSPGVFEKIEKEAFITVAGKTVTCKKSEATGKIVDQFTATETITFAKCALPPEEEEVKPGKIKLFKVPCTSAGQEAGTIKSTPLVQDLFYTTEEGTGPGFGLFNEEEEPIVSFTCANERASASYAVSGIATGTTENTGKSQVVKVLAGVPLWFAGEELLPGSVLEAGGEEANIQFTQEQKTYLTKEEIEALKAEGKKLNKVGIV